tara:strand:+ start:621 stop:1160 length:540 start_codon:yes stop_codon:yes gene_type:complete
LENDYRLLVYEPTEDAAERIANRYIKQPVDGYLDHSNYSALEYKELANKTKETYDQLLENEWFKRAAVKVQSQIAEQNRIASEIEAHNRREKELAKAAAKSAARSKFWGACIFWPLQVCALTFYLIIVGLFFAAADRNVEGASLGRGILALLFFGIFSAACQWGAIVQWKKHGGFISRS